MDAALKVEITDFAMFSQNIDRYWEFIILDDWLGCTVPNSFQFL